MANDNEIKVGDRVRDRICGLTGICWGITEYLAGCRRIHIQPEKLKEDGSVHEASAFDEPLVEVLDKRALSVEEEPKKKKTGGSSYLSANKPKVGAK
jgi:hypothetical protein